MSTFSATFRRPAALSDGAQEPSIAPIPGMTKVHRLEENVCAVIVMRTPEDLREIDEAASEIDAQGARYSEKLEAMPEGS